jgi:hypothetical protein
MHDNEYCYEDDYEFHDYENRPADYDSEIESQFSDDDDWDDEDDDDIDCEYNDSYREDFHSDVGINPNDYEPYLD